MADVKPDPSAMHEMMMRIAAAGPQHAGLARFAGRWNAQVKFWVDSGGPAERIDRHHDQYDGFGRAAPAP